MAETPLRQSQLPLNLSLRDSATFDNYVAGPNAQAVSYLRSLAGHGWEPGVYLWGAPGTGKSHLLQAVCHAAGAVNAAAVYLPMELADRFPSEALNGLENLSRICIDDIEAIAGRRDWEIALVHLIDRVHAAGGGLVVTGNAAPLALGLELAQLGSRLAGGLTLQLHTLDEADKLQALQLRAARRGLTLTVEAGRYLVRHYGQDMNRLFVALETVDQASLSAQRKLTIPFMRNVLSSSFNETKTKNY
jgi:DnaA family protein